MKSNSNRIPLASAQGTPPTNYPKTLLSIVSSVGGLTVFLLLGSSFLASRRNESSDRRNFYGVDSSRKVISGGIVTDTTNRNGSDVGTSRNFNADSRGVDQGNKDGEVGVFRNSDSSASQEKESDGVKQGNRYRNDSTLHKGKNDETLPSSNSNLDGVTSSSPTTMVEPQANSGKWKAR